MEKAEVVLHQVMQQANDLDEATELHSQEDEKAEVVAELIAIDSFPENFDADKNKS